ncbi:MAG: class I SAM-dependent methyltransferase [Chloroflexota bacterium]
MSDFDKFYDNNGWYYQLEPSEELAEFLSRQKQTGGKALDLGCGEGRDSILLARYGYEVTAVDISPSAIRKLNRYATLNNLDIKGTVADVTDFHITPQSFDLINAVTILDHIEFDRIKHVAKSISNGLASKGILFAEVFTTDDPAYHGGDNISETAKFINHFFERGELREIFVGLSVILYEEKDELDTAHGAPHFHNVAILIASNSRYVSPGEDYEHQSGIPLPQPRGRDRRGGTRHARDT